MVKIKTPGELQCEQTPLNNNKPTLSADEYHVKWFIAPEKTKYVDLETRLFCQNTKPYKKIERSLKSTIRLW